MNSKSRQWSRYPTLSLATLQLYGPGVRARTFSGCVLDVSLGGAGVRCSCTLDVGTSMWIRIDLEGERLVALAEVVNADPISRSGGLLFTRMDRDSFSVLHRFVSLQQAGDPAPSSWALTHVVDPSGRKGPASVGLLSGRSA